MFSFVFSSFSENEALSIKKNGRKARYPLTKQPT